MAAKQPQKKREYDDNFYETMPGGLYMDSNAFLPGRLADESDLTLDRDQDSDSQSDVRKRMVRQSLILISLLVAQIVLFMLLITYTVNLG